MEIDTENIGQVTKALLNQEQDLESMSSEQIQFEIKIIESFLEELQKKKNELEQEIELYEEDCVDYEKEKLQEVNTSIETVSNYLDRLYDFESFAE